jgi:hypothetical protein
VAAALQNGGCAGSDVLRRVDACMEIVIAWNALLKLQRRTIRVVEATFQKTVVVATREKNRRACRGVVAERCGCGGNI